jgi:CRISPR/Cas system-associated exonuclease Cas4 (RecB family)
VKGATKQEGLVFSVTQANTYLGCPRKYEYRYVRGVEPTVVPVALAFGVAFHSALAHHYGWLMRGSPASVKEVQDRFTESLRQAAEGKVPLQQDEDSASVEELRAKGLTMLEVALAHPSAMPEKVLAVEEPFTVELHHPDTGELLEEKLTGVLDLVVEEDGHRVLVEHKTAARKWTADQLAFDTQLSAYAFAAGQLGWGDVGLRFSVTTKTKTPAMQVEDVRRDEGDVADFLRTAVGVLKAIDAGVYFPIRGWQCRTCPYRTRCERER